MSTEAQRADVPPRPTSPPPPLASSRLPDHAPAVDSAAAVAGGPASTDADRLPPRPAGAETSVPPMPAVPPRPAAAPAAPAAREAATAGDAPVAEPSNAGPRPGSSPSGTQAPVAPRSRPGPETPTETTTRLRPVTAGPLPPEAPRRPAGAPPRPASHPPQDPPGLRRRRPVGSVDLTPRPDAGPPLVFAPPAAFDDHTTRLRPVRRSRARIVAATTCLVLGVGLIAGAVTGSWLTGESGAAAADADVFAAAADAWHSEPVDTLFPRTVAGEGAGPGGADRRWTRIAVAPDSTCAKGLDPLLLKTLETAGCKRLVRATYTDATHSYVTTVGMAFTEADAETMSALRTRFDKEGLTTRPELMPGTYPVKGTVAEDFGPRQRASWSVSVLNDAPVVVFAVSGFADGRAVEDPEPAAQAMAEGATSAPAQSGLGHEAQGLADRIERGLRKKAAEATEDGS
ncbi:hypothetical protein H9Y04_23500 [Streptomyces sp. TRM66268-LWL]|uniref:Uncharacterized protein n=1 Tax=Streptomyces polyasparticus TaxID=2767826 RepID=A0ABR7SJQ0_9ACTN|nr:hypothetical protein [Streptomyces polyasparticus]MBC9715519.1 hypothetical protein [Streptomyces polyasparticus]